jgi:hypothetical protein
MNQQSGGSLQERIDAMRKQGVRPEIAERNPMSKSSDPGAESPVSDEAFLEKFQQHLKQCYSKGTTSSIHPKTKSGADRMLETRQALLEKNAQERQAVVVPPRAGVAKPGLPPTPRAGHASAPSAPSAGSPAGALPPDGAILHLATGQVIVIDRNVPDSGYQMVLLLNPDGSVSAEKMNLRLGCQFRQIGRLSADDVVNVHVAHKWHRTHIVFNLDRFEDARLIPETSAPETQELVEPELRDAEWPAPGSTPQEKIPLPRDEKRAEAARQGQTKTGLKRGQRLTISFGPNRSWDAVYWGGDGTGTLVAHQTHGDWALTRLDLSRFAEENIVLGALMTDREIWELEEFIKRTYL